MSPLRLELLLSLAIALGSCGEASPTTPRPDAATDGTAPDGAFDAHMASDDVSVKPDGADAVAAMLRERPYMHRVPSSYTPTRAWPLVVVLHGYGAAGLLQSMYFGLITAVESRGILLAIPEGTFDDLNRRFWNATDVCCDLGRRGVDDVAYLTAVIEDMAARYRVDRGRVYLVGHSNGGFMAHRMACDRADHVAAILSLAGATWNDPSRCRPSRPVAVLQVHGIDDRTIRYEGGMIPVVGGTYPSARATVASWARLNRCAETFTEVPMRADYVMEAPGAETRIGRHEGCAPGGAAELWSMEATEHIPGLNAAWTAAALDWLEAHARR